MAGLYPDDEVISVFGNEVVFPGLDPETHKFTNGDFADPLKKPSFIPAETINLVLDNLDSFITGLGLTPNNTDPGQLLAALNSKFATTEWIKNFVFPVGRRYTQHLNDPTPLELGLPGQCEIWSGRADGYGLVSGVLPSYTNYTAGANYASGAYVMNHKAGGDWRIYRANKTVTGAPADLNPVDFDVYAMGVIVERRQLQEWTDPDFTIGTQISGGTYDGWRVGEIIVPGGKFDSVEGENRPTYVSGGVQIGRIVNITGAIASGRLGYIADADTAGALYGENSGLNRSGAESNGSKDAIRIRLDASRVVPTGPDVASTNLSCRYWRRVA